MTFLKNASADTCALVRTREIHKKHTESSPIKPFEHLGTRFHRFFGTETPSFRWGRKRRLLFLSLGCFLNYYFGSMEQLKGYIFRFKPTSEQAQRFRRAAGCNRLVWNHALGLQKRASEEGQLPIFSLEMSSFLTHWKRDPFPWLYDAPADTLQQTLRDLDSAWKKCVKEGAGAPRFKKRERCRESFRFPKDFRFDNRRVFLPKFGWVGFFKSREMVDTPRNLTIFKRAGRWYMSVCCKQDAPDPVHPSVSVVGLDLGVARFATLSDGSFVPPLNSLRTTEGHSSGRNASTHEHKKAVVAVKRLSRALRKSRPILPTPEKTFCIRFPLFSAKATLRS